MTEETSEFKVEMKDAVELHGHLGPFLVIGFRMGKAAIRILNPENQQNVELHASVEVPLLTPFSCILDGIQSTTHCTIGNQRLRVKESRQKISARFETRGSDKTLTITVSPEIVKDLRDKISKGTSNEALAEAIASTPEHQFLKFNIKRKARTV